MRKIKTMLSHRFIFVLVVASFVLANIACGSSTEETEASTTTGSETVDTTQFRNTDTSQVPNFRNDDEDTTRGVKTPKL
ncbi:hypothetical protein [Aridibaculum aurantiacum]|uniref:hypothetical protein n=1 Tax=Aridibaculum aurantiacum TaxID=2810307 RepID=UPI001A967E56|nr:hypothetical protein [Aridibaculum aurantiacum]